MLVFFFLNSFSETESTLDTHLKYTTQDLPGVPVVGSLPANAGDMGSVPGPERVHMPRSNQAHGPQLQSPLLKPVCPRARTMQQEKSPQREAQAPRRRTAPTFRNERKPACSNKDPAQPNTHSSLKKNTLKSIVFLFLVYSVLYKHHNQT